MELSTYPIAVLEAARDRAYSAVRRLHPKIDRIIDAGLIDTPDYDAANADLIKQTSRLLALSDELASRGR